VDRRPKASGVAASARWAHPDPAEPPQPPTQGSPRCGKSPRWTTRALPSDRAIQASREDAFEAALRVQPNLETALMSASLAGYL
jgi:hypothetical protein